MWIKFVISVMAVVFCLCQADAAVHPNQRKISKWNGKIGKYQAKIDHENSLAPTAMVMAPVTAVQTVSPVQTTAPPPSVEQPAAPAALPADPAPPSVVYAAPVITYPAPVVRVRTYAVAPYLAVPVYRAVVPVAGVRYMTWAEWRAMRRLQRNGLLP